MGTSRPTEGTWQVFQFLRGSSYFYQKYKFLAVNAIPIAYVYPPVFVDTANHN
jgi:hypothetical protein